MNQPGTKRPVNARWMKRNFHNLHWRTKSRYKLMHAKKLAVIRDPLMRPLLRKGRKP